MLSLGTEKLFAFSTAEASVMLPSTLPPPSRAATSTARSSFAYMFDRFVSVASFFRLMVAHFEWPDMRLHLLQQIGMHRRLAHQLGVERRHEQVPLLQHDRGSFVLGEHAHAWTHVDDARGPDEHTAHRVIDPGHLEIGLERVHLAAVRVAPYAD